MIYEKPTIQDLGSIARHTFTNPAFEEKGPRCLDIDGFECELSPAGS